MGVRGPSKSEAVTAPLGTFELGFNSSFSVTKWFTTVQEVRVLLGTVAQSNSVSDEEQLLSGTSENSLNFSNIKIDSEVVKKVNTVLPPDSLTVVDYTLQSLTNSALIQGYVQVFDSGEDFLLTEGVDYEIDYAKGLLRLVQPSAEFGVASEGSAGVSEFNTVFYSEYSVSKVLSVHYNYYSNFVRNVDYTINYATGRIARIVSGDIESGEKVFVDYETNVLIDEDEISLAIDMTHVEILQSVGESFEGSTAKNLRYAEAYRSLAKLSEFGVSNLTNSILSGDSQIQKIIGNLKDLGRLYDVRASKFLQPYLSVGFESGGRPQRNQLRGYDLYSRNSC